jgi:magnesium-transporting ATPase (P-type)
VRIKDLEYFPADLILIRSSSGNGMAYIMTSSLDGEKNLKPRFALKEL